MISVSIVIPVYNVEEYIERCLKSVAAQTYKGNIECIIIDDCTLDNSMYLVNNFLANYKGRIDFKIVHHVQNKGLSAARNTGIKEAHGDYLYFLDSDDALYEDTIQVLADLCKGNIEIATGNFFIIRNGRKVSKLSVPVEHICGQKNVFNAFLRNQIYEMACNKLIRRDFIIENNLWFLEGILHEDTLWSFFVFYYCNEVFLTFKYTYRYFLRENSIMGTQSSKNILSRYKIFFIQSDFIDRHSLYKGNPALVNYMIMQKLLLLKHLIDFRFGNELISKVQEKMRVLMIFQYRMSFVTMLKVIFASLPLGILKLAFSKIIISELKRVVKIFNIKY